MSLDRLKDLIPIKLASNALPQSHPYRGKLKYQDEDGNEFYETWIPPNILPDASDGFYIIPKGLEGKMHAIAFDIYGTSKWWWMLCVYNDIVDYFTEATANRTIRYPSMQRLALIIKESVSQ